MGALLDGVFFYASTFVVFMGMGLLWDLWRHRATFEIAARSPELLCLAGAAYLALIVLQMTAETMGSGFPCTLKIWASYLSFGTTSAAYILRATRLVVVYDTDLRRKYQRMVKPTVQRKCMVVLLVPCCLIALVVQLRFARARKRAGVCYFFEETWSIFLPISLLYLAAMVAMANKLKGTHDVFRIREEIDCICSAKLITLVARTVHISLAHARAGDNWDDVFSPTVYDLIACSAVLFVSFYRPLKAFYGVGSRRSLRSAYFAKRIYSGDFGECHESSSKHADRGGGGWGNAKNPETWGVLRMLRDATLRPLLVNFCEQSLCGESVDFLVDVAINYESLSNPEEQFAALSEIVRSYLVQGSDNEVNVSNAYRNAAAAWLKKRDEFFALTEERRAHVLDQQRDEIAKMLGENLLTKFKQTPMAIAAMSALKEVAAAGAKQADEGSEGEDKNMKIMLQASAALQVARIQHMARAGAGGSIVGPGAIAGLNERLKNSQAYPLDDECSYDEGSDSLESYTFDTW